MNRNIAVIGLGKLGLPLASLFANAGHNVTGYDMSKNLIHDLESNVFTSSEPDLMQILRNSRGRIRFFNDIDDATRDAEAIFVIVPTPSDLDGSFSNKAVLNFLSNLNPTHFENRRVVIDIVSTVMPGSCDGSISQTIEESLGQKIGSNVGLCYNPEFIALGSVIKNMQEPDMHLLGQSSAWAGDVIQEILSSVVTRPVPCQRMSLKEAELVKIAVNNFVTMKISYANALYQASILLGGVEIDTVTRAIGLDTRIGEKYLKGAAPYGGPCFPRDTRALTALYERLGVPSDLSKATEEVNKSHVSFVTKFVKETIGNVKNVGLVGISYKSGTPVIEESPGVLIALDLIANGFNLIVWDDENARLPANLNENVKYAENLASLVDDSDYVVITRPTRNLVSLMDQIKARKRPYLDLWRQQE
jgi:UDPglucose 6-dehydrogenase